ncbi:MAG: GNAT family N-acetyltransferase [Acinetobacter sp.]|nr:GNAT family N-acetyltransferase [Acinetobacter sp.]
MIRESRIEDIPEIIQVIHESIRSCVLDHQRNESNIQIWLEKTNQSNLLLWLLYNDSWVYIDNNRVVGFILVNDQGVILLNYIYPEMQQQGIGKALLMNMMERMHIKKVKKITLDSTQTALHFYKKHGFKPKHTTDVASAQMTTHLVKYLS